MPKHFCKSRQGRPENSPAIYRWERLARHSKSRRADANGGARFSRPYGTCLCLTANPSDESLGYFRLSRRDIFKSVLASASSATNLSHAWPNKQNCQPPFSQSDNPVAFAEMRPMHTSGQNTCAIRRSGISRSSGGARHSGCQPIQQCGEVRFTPLLSSNAQSSNGFQAGLTQA